MEQEMQQPPPTNYNDIMTAMSPVMRQLDRLDERTRDIATKSDLESLRKELVTRDAFEPQLNGLKLLITQANEDRIRDKEDRIRDKEAIDKRIDRVEADQLSRQDRLWMRFGQIIGILAFILGMFEFLSHYRFTP